MAIVRRSRYGDQTTHENRDGRRTRKFTQVWDVELESSDPDPISGLEVQRLPGLPIPGFSTYSPRPGRFVPFAICRSSSPQPMQGNRRFWKVTKTFELIGTDDEDKGEDEDPISLAPKVEPFVELTDYVIYKDFDNRDVVDPFNDLFAEPVRAPIPLKGVLVTRYVKSFDENTLADWLQTTNETAWRGQSEDAWCITEVTGQEVQFGNFTIGQLQFKIVSHPVEISVSLNGAAPANHRVGWLSVRAARSTTFIDSNGKRQTHRLEGAGSPPSMTWVNKDGEATDTPYFQAFRIRRQKNFNLII